MAIITMEVRCPRRRLLLNYFLLEDPQLQIQLPLKGPLQERNQLLDFQQQVIQVQV